MAVTLDDFSIPAAPAADTAGSVLARDGTSISYRKVGRGPGLVMLHGAMESAISHMQLARCLADAFTVYLPDRRGHHRGGPGAPYGIQQEVDDLQALLDQTGARAVFGVSSGGLIALQAALVLPALRKAALYEPALIVGGSASTAFLPRYEREIAQGKLAAALITGMRGGKMGPPIFDLLPRWLLESLTAIALRREDAQAQPGDITMRMLAPTLQYDFQLVAEMAESQERFRAVPAEVLLLGGSKSPAWLKKALDALEQVLPHVQRVELAGLNHGGSSDLSATNRASNPEAVAQATRPFLAS